MSIGTGFNARGQGVPAWRPPEIARTVMRLRPGERWYPDEIVEIEAKVSDALLPARVLTVDVTRRRSGRGAVVSRSFPCIPAYACYRDLCWWLRTLPSYDPEIEDMVVEWSSAVAERLVDAAQEA
ncbi:MAG TPA: hypothetical protein VFL14_05090 [Xanthomonadales bacterium]|nr:hypothetical protein [Xanthomonadales bacterium]